MNFYETVFILDAAPDAIDAEIQKVVDLIAANKGKVVSVDRWGMRKLAYEIKKQSKGYFVHMDYLGPADLPAEVERNLRLDERILGYLTVKLADKVDPESIQVKAYEPRRSPEAAGAPDAAESPGVEKTEG